MSYSSVNSETRVSTRRGRVVYEMEPFVADEIAAILQREATSGKTPDKWDKGFLDDAQALIEASNAIADPPGDTE